MNTIEEKLARKREELAKANTEQERRWAAYKDAQTKLRTEYETPWHEALGKLRAIALEVQVLEGVLNEMAVA